MYCHVEDIKINNYDVNKFMMCIYVTCMNILIIISALLCMWPVHSSLKGGGDEVSDIFGSLFLRVPLHVPILLQK